MTFVWRVETLAGDGPYKGMGPALQAHIKGMQTIAEAQRHPKPELDDGLKEFWSSLNVLESTAWSFGFKTLEQYLRWFYTRISRDILDAEGAVLRRFKIGGQYVRIGDAQAIFLKDYAELVEERACNFK